MWNRLIIVLVVTGAPFTLATDPVTELPGNPGGLQRYVSDGVTSVGYKIVYGDEDMAVINEVVSQVEDNNILKKKINLNEAIDPLPPQDVKCLMSVDRYCSPEMGYIKSVLIQAVKEDCEKCTTEEKDKAGKVIASMMAHDMVAWKLFLTRSVLQYKKPNETRKQEDFKIRAIGEPEEVIRSTNNRYAWPGVKVRVKRFVSELVPNTK